MPFPNPLKPWYLYRPRQLLRRTLRAVRPPADPVQILDLPWGCAVEADIRETIGRSIWTTGVHDLAVAEVLFRLSDPAKLSLDVGANLGAFTGLLARRSQEVWAFEPHPTIADRLKRNVGSLADQSDFAPCRVFSEGLSDEDGRADLVCPDDFTQNQGISRLDVANRGGVSVETRRLDGVLNGRDVGLMKVDVEGHEAAVFRGATESITAGRISHIVFEEHGGPGSAACAFVRERGYELFAIEWRLTGPVLRKPEAGLHASTYEAPNYLASLQPGQAAAACRPRGWQVLSSSTGRRLK